MKTIPSTKLIRFWCYLFGHKVIYFEEVYAGEVEGISLCKRCSQEVIEKQY